MEEARVGRKERNLDVARGPHSHTVQSQNWVSGAPVLPVSSSAVYVRVWKRDLCESRLILLQQRADRLKTTVTES